MHHAPPSRVRPRALSLPEFIQHLEGALGVAATEIACSVEIYLPDRDRHGALVAEHARWVERAQALLTSLFGGCTGYDTAGSFAGLLEQTRVLRAEVFGDVTSIDWSAIANFLSDFGRETNQAEVWMLLTYHGVRLRASFDCRSTGLDDCLFQ